MKRISIIALAPAFGVATFTDQGLKDAVAAWLANEEMEHGEEQEHDDHDCHCHDEEKPIPCGSGGDAAC